jgi:hypothetical protein
MPFAALLFAVLAASPSPSPAAAPVLDNVSLGEALSAIRARSGDPVVLQTLPNKPERVWRFLEQGTRLLDVMEHNGVAVSITVARYTKDAAFTDSRGLSFGTSMDGVTSVLGDPDTTSTNADDGSRDLWYRRSNSTLIYEFLSDRLVFEQLLAPPSQTDSGKPDVAAEPHTGASPDDALVVSPPADAWIRAFFELNTCGTNGFWRNDSKRVLQKGPTYNVVHATCTTGNSSRDFYFQLPPPSVTI